MAVLQRILVAKQYTLPLEDVVLEDGEEVLAAFIRAGLKCFLQDLHCRELRAQV